MKILVTLIGTFLIARSIGWLGVDHFNNWHTPLQVVIALIMLVGAAGHWGKVRQDMIRMVPRMLPNPAFLVTLTGILEIIGAVALLIPATSKLASIYLIALLILMFPANIRAAQKRLPFAGKESPKLLPRTVMQVILIVLIWLAG
ncbi:hypothetical protein A374_17044 [Fictibacillus macauensis ZFHKF-1]|uniref:DoxX family protein n=1 Tax=Fictibacillus macauensis ZFHKF-1 TaxID=1196324 RepID=I8AFH4_9BACL|nr:DoxX family protein [Fictibacillus macauensis]EIT84109.1 hypothetical protein A374_17044 [Fictibacillus macauensis ZFHKF-1]